MIKHRAQASIVTYADRFVSDRGSTVRECAACADYCRNQIRNVVVKVLNHDQSERRIFAASASLSRSMRTGS